MSNPAPMTTQKPKQKTPNGAPAEPVPATEKDVRAALKSLRAEYAKKMAPLRTAVKEAKKLAAEYKPRFAPLKETLKAMRTARVAALPKVGDVVEIVNEKKKAYFGKQGRVVFTRGKFLLVKFNLDPASNQGERDFRLSEVRLITPT